MRILIQGNDIAFVFSGVNRVRDNKKKQRVDEKIMSRYRSSCNIITNSGFDIDKHVYYLVHLEFSHLQSKHRITKGDQTQEERISNSSWIPRRTDSKESTQED